MKLCRPLFRNRQFQPTAIVTMRGGAYDINYDSLGWTFGAGNSRGQGWKLARRRLPVDVTIHGQ